MESQELTPFDSMVSDNQLQIIKAAIPFLSAREQQFFSVYVKYIEFSHTLNLVREPGLNTLSSCSISEEQHSTADMLAAIKQYCTDKEKEMIDLLSNFLSAYQMYHAYQELVPKDKNQPNAQKKESNTSSMADTLKGMLTPEQQSMLGTCMKLFPSSNNS